MLWLTEKFLILMLCLAALVLGAYTVLPYFLPNLVKDADAQVTGLPAEIRNPPSIAPFPLAENEQLVLKPDDFHYPIMPGQTGPIENDFGIPLQYPFYCETINDARRHPLVDNHDGIGMPVYRFDDLGQRTDDILGYSKDCSQPTRVDYYYNRAGTDKFYPLEEAAGDIARIQINGQTIDFVVRLETGTINRFIYGIAALRGPDPDAMDKPVTPRVDSRYWNKRLIYQFNGGVGIGHLQGKFSIGYILDRRRDQLARGYAVAYSTGNHTRNHYNMRLAEDTARRVKQQFISVYGEPVYTVGIGGSGGAVQQYLIAQNSGDILDAILPLYSYPDMVTQIIPILDCELLEYYFDVTDGKNPLWALATNKERIVGLHANNHIENIRHHVSQVGAIINGNFNYRRQGTTECINGWRGLTPLINNPRFFHHSKKFTNGINRVTHWTHWDDLRYFYGSDERGYANSFWDNVGVQYGLEALKEGFISPEQFIHLNRHIGGWKPAAAHEDENFWAMNDSVSLRSFSPWSHQNMTHAGLVAAAVAPRTAGNADAARAIVKSGHVFTGHLQVPAIDIRHYLEEELDMHHLSASFATRARIQRAGGDIDNVPIWVSHKDYTPIDEAFSVIDQWLLNMAAHPEKSLAENRPSAAVDSCFDRSGELLAAGNQVWQGGWNRQPAGPCLKLYPAYKNSRIIAGESIHGDLFKCRTIPVQEAIDINLYSPVDMAPWRAQLQEVFPDGVCYYD